MKKVKFMNKVIKKMSKKVAQPPGTLIHVGEQKAESVTLNLIRYSKDIFEEKKMEAPDEFLLEKDFKGVCWVDISGIHDIPTIETIGSTFNIHALVQEDILNTHQRPKFENYEDYHFVVLKMLQYDTEAKEIMSEQVSFVLGPNFLLTFQEQEGDVFNPVRERLQKALGRIRKRSADFLLYTLIDAVVDHYFLVLEAMGEELEILEDQLLENPTPEVLHAVHKLKREIIFLKKAVWPLRELINTLQKTESQLVKNDTKLYLRDVYDHTVQVIDTVETYRDMVSGLQDLYLSSVSNKMNEVMKVLTIIATIFIPLTFIAGIYGMNFEFMPELKWKIGYFFIWGLMLVIALIMLLYFRRKKWL
jgi:magnesium transporter